ncbi:MAG: small basic protein [Phycisphaera sp.]|nr:small basic protein [Phycisphaera sp.]
MSLDRSLKVASGLSRHRNVLSRPERVAKLAQVGKFDLDKGEPLHMPKVANRKAVAAKSAKKAKEGEEGTAAAPAAAAAPAGKGKK